MNRANDAMTLIAHETALREGETVAALDAPLLVMPTFSIASDAFLLTLPSGLRFHYRKGDGVTFSRPTGLSDAEVALFHSGSVYGAVAWLNGLVPLHASAIVHEGKVHAFTGDSGAGKSTLSAALSQRELPLFADDVLVLDLSDPARPLALPGHKRLKLWGESLKLTGLEPREAVRDNMDKYFVRPPALKQDAALPLESLYFLDAPTGRAPSISPISGAARFARVRAALYRPRFCSAVVRPVDLFTMAGQLGASIGLHVFDRPRERERFDENVDFLAANLRTSHG